jgi:DNA (cytosine-5)-methyltransferase 1
MKYSVIDLFCGCGGGSLGLKLADCDIVGAVDIDPIACKLYSENLSLEPLCGDLRNLGGTEILKHYGLRKGDIDIIIGCPPCQSFSSLRRTRGLPKENGTLLVSFIKRIQEIRPRLVVFENVPGITTLGEGKYLRLYLKQMDKMGYSSVWGILDAADYGVPQHRKRVLVFSVNGENGGQGLIMPQPLYFNPRKAAEIGKPPWITVREAIHSLPPLKPGESDPTIPNHKARRHSPRVLEIIRNVPKDGGSRKSLPRHLWLECHRELDNGGAESVYGRMWWDRPSPTITSRCTCPSSGRFIHPEQDRAITPREAARLQSFPDSFIFPSEIGLAEKYIGNAVPPIFISNLFQSFISRHDGLF